ncbi:MAG: hypothetical protein I3J02_04330 [Prevotella sp.]|nr:hypothetical protein [Prevotella sp.]
MKRIFTLIALAANVVIASATDYTDALQVNVNGNTSTQSATISLNRQDNGSYAFVLKNFVLTSGGQQMGIGTIEVDNVAGTDVNGVTTLVANQTVPIQEGDIASPSGMWIGPSMLGSVPVKLIAEQRGEKLYAVIDIDMQSTLQQTIKVTFGNGGYQIGNSGFEDFHSENGINEPNHWHSFASCTGAFAGFVSGTAHTFVSDVVRPGTTGSHSVMVTSTQIFGITANGTITTGRMSAGAISPDDPANHAETDMSSTATDSNGDPFYAEMNGLPDSLAVWVKFTQGTPDASHPYATVNAVITDGTYYQDPEDKTYNNKLARAANNTIASNGSKWQRVCVPFNGYDNPSTPKAILVTLSTNADPGTGSLDTLYVDDLSLIYNQDITVKGISIQGQALAVADTMDYASTAASVISTDDIVVDTNAPKVFKSLETTADGAVAYITVASTDLQTFKTYVVNLKGAVTGIESVDGSAATTKTIYNLQGQRVGTMVPGQVYIINGNGRAVKVLKK